MSIAIVAHPKRREQANELAQDVDADIVFWDRESKGAEHNHVAAWKHFAHASTERAIKGYHVVLEDDAIPFHWANLPRADQFRAQLERVLAAAPADVVSLYLGTGYPTQWQDSIRTAVPPDADPHFLTAPDLLSCVGYAVKAGLIRDMVGTVLWRIAHHNEPIDRAISGWCREKGLTVAYCRPSIVNHRDEEPLIEVRHDGQDRRAQRRAWKFGQRLYWEPKSLPIEEPKLVYTDAAGRRFYEQREKVYD